MPITLDDLDSSMTITQVAERLHNSRRHVERLLKNGEIDYMRLGNGRGRIYITERALTEYINRRNVRSTTTASARKSAR